jgi:hypothetical protein
MKSKINEPRKLFFAALLAVSTLVSAQTGIGTTAPDASAELDVESTTRGFLPPRMTQEQMIAIPSPAEGLVVYFLDCAAGRDLYVNTDSGFVNVATGVSATEAANTNNNNRANGFSVRCLKEHTSYFMVFF